MTVMKKVYFYGKVARFKLLGLYCFGQSKLGRQLPVILLLYVCGLCRIENRKIKKLALTVQNLSVLNENEVERTAILLTLRSLTPWHGRHEKCPTHNYVPALWLITPLVCHFCVQKEKIEKKK